jgi:hypothetical protein
MFSYFFDRKSASNPDDKFHPFLSQQDLLSPDDSYQPMPSQEDAISAYLVSDAWNIVLSYFSNFSDFENMAILSHKIAFNFLGKDPRLTDLLINTAYAHLQINEITSLMQDINGKVDAQLRDLRDIEEKRPVKKSTFARAVGGVFSLIPGASLVPLGLQKKATGTSGHGRAKTYGYKIPFQQQF